MTYNLFKKSVISLCFLSIIGLMQSNAQVGIGTVLPDESAQLDITATNKGVLIPRIALTGLNDTTTIIGGNVDSLIVYNTTATNGLTPGYYYWNNTGWERLIDGNDLDGAIDNLSLSKDTSGNLQIETDGTPLGTAIPFLEQGNLDQLITVGPTDGGIRFTATDLATAIANNPNSQIVISQQETASTDPSTDTTAGDIDIIVGGRDSIVATGTTIDVVSSDTNNALDVGSDGGSYLDASTMVPNAANGVVYDATDARLELGGTLVEATEVVTTSTNTLAVSGLQAGATTDNVVVTDPTSGVLRAIAPADLVALSDLRLVDTNNHITQDAGVGGTGTTAGSGDPTSGESINTIAIGPSTGNALTTASSNILIGANAGQSITIGNENVKIGVDAGRLNVSGARNVFLGFRTAANIPSGQENVVIGNQALRELATGTNELVVIGNQAGRNLTTTENIVAIGSAAMLEAIDIRNSVAVGSNALRGTAATVTDANVAIGAEAMRRITTGIESVAVGFNAMANSSTASQNVAVGIRALRTNNGTGNVAVGNRALENNAGSNNIAIGNDIEFSTGNSTSNALNIGNIIYGQGTNAGNTPDLANLRVGIGVQTPAATLDINGTVVISDDAGSAVAGSAGFFRNAGEVTVFDASGNNTVISPHNFSLIDTPSEPMAWSFYSKNTPLNRQINVDMLRLTRVVERLSGEKLVYQADLQGNRIDATPTEISEIDRLKFENKALKARIAKIEAALGITN